MKLNRLMMALTFSGFAACNASTTTSVAETAAALETVQSNFCEFRAQAEACRAAFDACLAVAGADEAACRTTLHDCLPPPPPRPEGMGGGRCEGMGPGGGGVRPPPPLLPDGGLPPPPPGGPHQGGRGPGGPGGPHPGGAGGPPPQPEPAAVQACRDALTACLAATPGDATCLETERTCVRDAFRAAFEAACADATTACASLPAEACTRLTQRCAEGVDGRVDADGGVCSAPPPVIP